MPLYRKYSSVASGTAFPSAPASNNEFRRTDRGMDYYYDGTRWLSKQLFELPLANQGATIPYTASGAVRSNNPHNGNDSLFATRLHVSHFVQSASPSTANSFSMQLSAVESTNSAINLGSAISTTGATQNSWQAQSSTIGVVVGSTVTHFNLAFNETGIADAFIHASLEYRLVGS